MPDDNNLIGNKVIELKIADSTNDYIKNNCLSYEEGLVVTADRQTNGRGRLGRQWLSDDDSALYMSVLLKPDVDTRIIPVITLLCGVAVCRAINDLCDACAMIKWPNDIIIGNKKLCGILCEGMISGNEASVIAGIGINVNNESFDESIKNKATSLFLSTGNTYDRKETARCVLFELDKLYGEFKRGDMSFMSEYKTLCVSLNRNVTFERDGKTVTAKATDIDSHGSLICVKNGIKYAVIYGEATVQGIY